MATKKNKRGSNALDPLMAGFSGGAAAFIIYAMPQPRFDDFVALSGLPMILSAAQPPLGMTARIAVMAAAGIAAFMIVWFVLRALGRPGARARRRAELEELEMAPPRLRRADMHPDAPSRRPILAGVDLGRSFDELPTDRDPVDEAEPVEAEAVFDEGEEQEEGTFSEVQPLYEASAYGAEPAEDVPASRQAERVVYVDPYEVEQPESSAIETAPEEEPVSEAYEPVIVEQEPEQEPEYEPAQEPEEEPEALRFELSSRQVETVDALSQRLPSASGGGGSIPDLMNRLEAGLQRRRPSPWIQPSGEKSNGSSGDPLDARLRGAIDELQRIASRGN